VRRWLALRMFPFLVPGGIASCSFFLHSTAHSLSTQRILQTSWSGRSVESYSINTFNPHFPIIVHNHFCMLLFFRPCNVSCSFFRSSLSQRLSPLLTLKQNLLIFHILQNYASSATRIIPSNCKQATYSPPTPSHSPPSPSPTNSQQEHPPPSAPSQ
jgi:hypothetical protein